MQNPEIEPALIALGFKPDDAVGQAEPAWVGVQVTCYPNPVSNTPAVMLLELAQPERLTAVLTDATGRIVRTIFQTTAFASGQHVIELPVQNISPGLYLISIQNDKQQQHTKKIVRIP